MPDAYFNFSDADRAEILATGADVLDRPAPLLEKDIWVVWTLSKLFNAAEVGQHLTFKGGTSLSKAYGVIRRFSEDIDLTVDIRHLLHDLVHPGELIPSNRSQEKKWSNAVKERLPVWISEHAVPLLQRALSEGGGHAELRQEADKLYLHYAPLKKGTGYVQPAVLLEFGARATGEPNQTMPIGCDIADAVQAVAFPTATPVVMKIERTFWEKATAAHVFCFQERVRGERYARHWYDLACIARSTHAASALTARDIAKAVAQHKSVFFREKNRDDIAIDYHIATSGALRLIPGETGILALREDYEAMLGEGLLPRDAPSFDDLMQQCQQLEEQANASLCK